MPNGGYKSSRKPKIFFQELKGGNNAHLFLRLKGYCSSWARSTRPNCYSSKLSWCLEAVVTLYLWHSSRISWERELAVVARQWALSSIDTHHRFLTKNRILLVNHSQHSPDLAPFGIYPLRKLLLLIGGMRYADISAIQKGVLTSSEPCQPIT